MPRRHSEHDRLAGQGDELQEKDIRLARDAAEELAIALPSATVADEMLARATQLGYAHRDLAALYQVLDQTPAAV